MNDNNLKGAPPDLCSAPLPVGALYLLSLKVNGEISEVKSESKATPGIFLKRASAVAQIGDVNVIVAETPTEL